MKVRQGDFVRIRELHTVNGDPIWVPDSTQLTHLQFRRFAGCPICNVHLQSVAARSAEIVAANIHEVVVFHSTTLELQTYTDELPFDVVADPDKQLYKEFGVETSLRSVLDPRASAPVLNDRFRRARRREKSSAGHPAQPTGGRLGLPADLLVDATGEVLACKYGRHAYDQWSVDDLLIFAGKPR
jgi:peroxiredoxin